MTILNPEIPSGNNETSQLLVPISGEVERSGSDEALLEEMEEPWPATFERSISILATPVLTERKVDMITKSPKPGNTPLFGGPRTVRFQLIYLRYFASSLFSCFVF